MASCLAAVSISRSPLPRLTGRFEGHFRGAEAASCLGRVAGGLYRSGRGCPAGAPANRCRFQQRRCGRSPRGPSTMCAEPGTGLVTAAMRCQTSVDMRLISRPGWVRGDGGKVTGHPGGRDHRLVMPPVGSGKGTTHRRPVPSSGPPRAFAQLRGQSDGADGAQVGGETPCETRCPCQPPASPELVPGHGGPATDVPCDDEEGGCETSVRRIRKATLWLSEPLIVEGDGHRSAGQPGAAGHGGVELSDGHRVVALGGQVVHLGLELLPERR